jgi:hypothetical protein
MEERASLLGGQFLLTSEPNEGTQVQVIIPYRQEMELLNVDPVGIGG